MALALLLALFASGCPEPIAPPGPARATADRPASAGPGAVLPATHLAFGALSGSPRAVPTLAQSRQALAHAATHAPLAEALRRAGMSDEAAARMVWAAAAHNAGQGLDPVHARAQQINAAMHAALQRFNGALDAEERRAGKPIDRAALNRRIGLPLARQEVLR